MCEHVSILSRARDGGEFAHGLGRGSFMARVPEFPTAPDFTDGAARMRWEQGFSEQVCRYFDIVEAIVGGWRTHGVCDSCGGGAGVYACNDGDGKYGSSCGKHVGAKDAGSGSDCASECGVCAGSTDADAVRVGGIDVVKSDAGGHVQDLNGVATSELRGKHYERNRRKREQEKERKRRAWRSAKVNVDWRRVDKSGGCLSDESSSGTVRTVDSRTAVEIEAAQTLAARRVVENELAIAQVKAKLASFGDKSKTEALMKLSAARMEQRINEAMAKSQASYKQCDKSLKSLGSSGSAGEFALKQQVKDAHQDRALLKYVEAQAAVLARDASPETLAEVARLPPPIFESEHEVFGECPDDYDEDEQFAYYRDLDRRELEQNERCLSFSPFQ